MLKTGLEYDTFRVHSQDFLESKTYVMIIVAVVGIMHIKLRIKKGAVGKQIVPVLDYLFPDNPLSDEPLDDGALASLSAMFGDDEED